MLELPFLAYNVSAVYLSLSEQYPSLETIQHTLILSNQFLKNSKAPSQNELDSDDSCTILPSGFEDAIDDNEKYAPKQQISTELDLKKDDIGSLSRNSFPCANHSPESRLKKRVRFSLGPEHVSLEKEEQIGGRSNKLRLQDLAKRRLSNSQDHDD
ncbi:hypothetical protein Ciccas_004712, partial [Cichlidogyrus casuarinus]